MRPRRASFVALVVAALAVVFALWQQQKSGLETTHAPSVGEGSASNAPAVPPPSAEMKPVEGARSPAWKVGALAPEERAAVTETLELIARGGPYPHAKDDSVFSNRERRLPIQARGYYREYTVETPGASNRGARRIVRGEKGETYYTRDHYATFIRIDE